MRMKVDEENKMKKICSAIICAVLSAVVITGCGDSQSEKTKDSVSSNKKNVERSTESVVEEKTEEASEEETKEASDNAEWKVLYIDAMMNAEDELGLYDYFGLGDINGDGVPEVFLSRSSGSSKYNSMSLFLLIDKDKNVLKSEMGSITYGNDYVYISDDIVLDDSLSKYSPCDIVYKYDRDNDEYLRVFVGTKYTENGENIFNMKSMDYPDGIDCSESEYNDALNMYTQNCTESVDCENTTNSFVEVINEY